MAGEVELLALVIIMLTIVSMMLVISRRYKKAGPDEALIVYGRARGPDGFKVVLPGRAHFLYPTIESFKVLSLQAHKVVVRVVDVTTKEGVPATIDVVAIVGVSKEPDMIRRAAQRILGKPWPEVEDICNDAVVAGVRGVGITWEIERINADRDGFSQAVRKSAHQAMSELGLDAISLTMRDVVDQVGYLEALGKKRTAEVKKEAIIGETAARRDAIRISAQHDKEGQILRIQADEDIERAKIDSKRRLKDYEEGRPR